MYDTKINFMLLLTPWLVLNVGIIYGEIYIPSRGRSGSIHQFYDQRVQALRPYMLTDMDHSMANIANSPRGGSTSKRTVTLAFSRQENLRVELVDKKVWGKLNANRRHHCLLLWK
ncbi:unnamed protein product [Allacma fusca]|uniref:Uncharacterized protein n=1 Tax=Allacma fusca TaxID=39272 RepID=A0A8J2JQU0_9HEXA|nr:unnamed protein product [Allacma fusca]